MKGLTILTIALLSLAVPVLADVGFTKTTGHSLLRHGKRERVLADSQQMLDAQDSREDFIYRG